MKAWIDCDGNLFVDKGNGFIPQLCMKNLSIQCGMLCPSFKEPKLTSTGWDTFWYGENAKQFIALEICNSTMLVFKSLYFEKTDRAIGEPLTPAEKRTILKHKAEMDIHGCNDNYEDGSDYDPEVEIEDFLDEDDYYDIDDDEDIDFEDDDVDD